MNWVVFNIKDLSIVRRFPSKEKAEEFKAKIIKKDDYDIAEVGKFRGDKDA